jgi:ABC-type branched-subunit amino acid transport system ATPase component
LVRSFTEEDYEVTERVLDQMTLSGLSDRTLSHLSGGEQQRAILARALVGRPRLLILDEPTASLAPKMVEDIFIKVRTINETGVAILIVEQNAKEALSICHRAYVLAMGHNRLEGTGPELLASEEVGKLYLGA